MINVLVEIEGGIVQNIFTDERNNEVQVNVIDIDKEKPIGVSNTTAEYEPRIWDKRCEYIINDLQKRLGSNVIVSPDLSGENPSNEFTGTLIKVYNDTSGEFPLVVKDQDDNVFEVDFDQVEFE